MPEHLDKPLCDSYEMPSCETTKTFNSEVLLNMLDMMAQMMKMVQEIFKALPPRKEVVLDFRNFDYEDPYTINNYDEIHGKIQRELGTRDHGDKLNIVEVVFDPIDIVVDVIVKCLCFTWITRLTSMQYLKGVCELLRTQ
ncbi:hypothetical protein PVK06_012219 [Gossypium arboreum]|uniref:Uncharacterized protein n=1 Tax=Gossypium arboreum TaxID=29729 RepID=A0ABR0QB66_GOSAR|nr:hypothetical protein PVK06_012219 [Gossypium arboreum]